MQLRSVKKKKGGRLGKEKRFHEHIERRNDSESSRNKNPLRTQTDKKETAAGGVLGGTGRKVAVPY